MEKPDETNKIHTYMIHPWRNDQVTFGKFTSKAAIMEIVEEQTNAAELDNPEPKLKSRQVRYETFYQKIAG